MKIISSTPFLVLFPAFNPHSFIEIALKLSVILPCLLFMYILPIPKSEGGVEKMPRNVVYSQKMHWKAHL